MPDTVISMMNGEKLLVREIARRARRAGPPVPALRSPRSGARLRASARTDSRGDGGDVTRVVTAPPTSSGSTSIADRRRRRHRPGPRRPRPRRRHACGRCCRAPPALIVFGGTLGAVLLSFPLRDLRHGDDAACATSFVDDAPPPDGRVAPIGRFARAGAQGRHPVARGRRRPDRPTRSCSGRWRWPSTAPRRRRCGTMLEDEIMTPRRARGGAGARVRGGRRLRADGRHPRRRARPDPRDGEPVRPEQPRLRHRRRVRRHRLRRRLGQPDLPARSAASCRARGAAQRAPPRSCARRRPGDPGRAQPAPDRSEAARAARPRRPVRRAPAVADGRRKDAADGPPPHVDPTPHVSHERWLVSYADFITLLFAFFTTMYAISTVDAQKMSKMVASMQVALEAATRAAAAPVPLPQTGLPQPVGAAPRQPRRAAPQLSARLQRQIRHGQRRDRRRPARPRRQHPRGRQLRQRQRRAVRRRARAARRHRGAAERAADIPIRIEGHTDDAPIRTARFRSNWELSTARATQVIAYLQNDLGLPAARLSAAGYGEFHPRVAERVRGGARREPPRRPRRSSTPRRAPRKNRGSAALGRAERRSPAGPPDSICGCASGSCRSIRPSAT